MPTERNQIDLPATDRGRAARESLKDLAREKGVKLPHLTLLAIEWFLANLGKDIDVNISKTK